LRFVELEEARQASGLRLVIATNVPSPWSQAALGLFDMKGLDYLAVRYRRTDEEIRRWTGARNVPAVLFDDEPPRTGWAEIVTLGERLGGRMSLVPEDDDRRVRMFGLSHEILGEGGLGWNVRLLVTHASLTTDGRTGWPKPVAEYLAPRYGCAPSGSSACSTPCWRRAAAKVTPTSSARARRRSTYTWRSHWVRSGRCQKSNAPCCLPFATRSRRSIRR
jgi:hypothetical protein